MRGILLGTVICVAAIPAWSQTKPEPNKDDPSVLFIPYDDTRTNPLTMPVGTAANITFDPMETVKHVVLGNKNVVGSMDPKDVNQDPVINNVPIVAVSVGVTTVIITTSTTDGHERPYVFSIKVVKEQDNPSTLIKFTYAAQQKAVAVQQAQMTWKEKAAQKQQAIVEARLNVDPMYCTPKPDKSDCINYQFYVQTRSNSIAPPRVTDNGRITAFQFPGAMERPTVLLVRDGIQRPAICDGKKPDKATLQAPEEALNMDGYNDMILVHKLGAHFRLRNGNTEVGEIYNCAFDPVGRDPGTGTSSPDVYRKVISSAQ